MIGKIIIGKSFRGCISYCLDKDRAEVLQQHLCFGEKKEIIQQFNEVRQLNERVSKPVMHITLSLVPGERLSGKQHTSYWTPPPTTWATQITSGWQSLIMIPATSIFISW